MRLPTLVYNFSILIILHYLYEDVTKKREEKESSSPAKRRRERLAKFEATPRIRSGILIRAMTRNVKITVERLLETTAHYDATRDRNTGDEIPEEKPLAPRIQEGLSPRIQRDHKY